MDDLDLIKADIAKAFEEQRFMEPYAEAANDVLEEVKAARERFPAFHSGHEGYGVILEELDELWDEIKAQNSERKMDNMYKEAKQVAAMAIAFMVDVCKEDMFRR